MLTNASRRELIGYAKTLVDTDRAEDVVSRAILQYIESPESRKHGLHWLVRRHAERTRRLDSRRELVECRLGDTISALPSHDCSVQLDITAAIDSLPAKVRRATVLHLAGYSYVDIAKQLGVSETTVVKHTSSGLNAMRKFLTAYRDRYD